MKLRQTVLFIFSILTITFILSSATDIQAIEITSVPAAPMSTEALKRKYDKQEVYITMRDGVRLFTSIYTPKNKSVAHPFLLNRTPYDIEPGGP